MYEIHGSHCSCYGFEDQLDLEPTTKEALLMRINKKELFYCGGYDENTKENQLLARNFINQMK